MRLADYFLEVGIALRNAEPLWEVGCEVLEQILRLRRDIAGSLQVACQMAKACSFASYLTISPFGNVCEDISAWVDCYMQGATTELEKGDPNAPAMLVASPALFTIIPLARKTADDERRKRREEGAAIQAAEEKVAKENAAAAGKVQVVQEAKAPAAKKPRMEGGHHQGQWFGGGRTFRQPPPPPPRLV